MKKKNKSKPKTQVKKFKEKIAKLEYEKRQLQKTIDWMRGYGSLQGR
tara:strand:- start:1219 stop:1359 length:141 start_codon:yes stop_codon:yes gene_type:complete